MSDFIACDFKLQRQAPPTAFFSCSYYNCYNCVGPFTLNTVNQTLYSKWLHVFIIWFTRPYFSNALLFSLLYYQCITIRGQKRSKNKSSFDIWTWATDGGRYTGGLWPRLDAQLSSRWGAKGLSYLYEYVYLWAGETCLQVSLPLENKSHSVLQPLNSTVAFYSKL